MNLEHLSKWMNVSRTTIKKDLLLIEEQLQKLNLQLVYKQGYRLIGNENALLNERVGFCEITLILSQVKI